MYRGSQVNNTVVPQLAIFEYQLVGDFLAHTTIAGFPTYFYAPVGQIDSNKIKILKFYVQSNQCIYIYYIYTSTNELCTPHNLQLETVRV